ncbi:MAG: adenylate/guanylate cyclase protein [Devosia sp.]|uniref:adenylate/guanylate cyclase domain-containing protein n=1 Tax=Devosia sp. TaxID=1871048 RepID=UPI00260F26BA|nr:adenylate/guanylate cyclase domain-containing protein [Devosia sp.]MDB5529211.1 adenylate/guanylate cyclase protein [Devosia sp.]
MAKSERRLVPIVSIDVVGFSRLVQHSELQTVRLVRRLYEHFAVGRIEAMGGKVFKTMGDGLLAEFNSVIAAVDWVAAVQKELNSRQVQAPGGEILQVRAGIVMADVLVHGDDLFGNGVNLAVRVQGVSPPGGMAVTKWMYEYLIGQSDLQFSDMGPTILKNIPKTVRIFVWHPQGTKAAEAAAPVAIPLPASKRPSLVVMPFDNMSGEADQGYFADAVVEEITATLARIKDFFVIARNSAFAYKGRSVDVRQVGRELGVRYVVEGSVRRVGERVRITAQLVETETGNHIWSDKVDGTVHELFDLQDTMAALVASAISPSIRQAEIDLARSKRPDTLAAYDLVMRAMPHLWSHLPHENREAITLLDQALALEPSYGLAAALAAWAHGQQVAYNWTSDIAAERLEAKRLIELAATTVAGDPTAMTALASAMMQTGGDVAQATALADRALALDPNHAWAWMRRGFGQVYLGNPEDGLTAFERSARLSPLDPFSFNMYLGMALAHFGAGRPQQSVAFAQRALAERPGLIWPYRDLATYYANWGETAAARDALEKFRDGRTNLTLASVSDSLRFMHPALLSRYIGGLKLAGLE